jgi:hypothetical protein
VCPKCTPCLLPSPILSLALPPFIFPPSPFPFSFPLPPFPFPLALPHPPTMPPVDFAILWPSNLLANTVLISKFRQRRSEDLLRKRITQRLSNSEITCSKNLMPFTECYPAEDLLYNLPPPSPLLEFSISDLPLPE